MIPATRVVPSNSVPTSLSDSYTPPISVTALADTGAVSNSDYTPVPASELKQQDQPGLEENGQNPPDGTGSNSETGADFDNPTEEPIENAADETASSTPTGEPKDEAESSIPEDDTIVTPEDDPGSNPSAPDRRPDISFTADPELLQPGGSVTLTWETTNATECEADGDLWNGRLPVSGQALVNNIDATSEVKIQCGNETFTASASAIVTVVDPILRWLAPTTTTDGNPLNDLAGYEIYYGSEVGSYTGVIVINNPDTTEYRLDMSPGGYYVAMVAINAENVRSALSDTVFKYIAE
ncbi:MAG: hypothetical protein AAGG11_21000 [Pseudomonadota bacterium]